MSKFIRLTTKKHEEFLVNVDNIAYICKTKDGCEICIGEFETYSVIETFDYIFSLLSEKISN